MTEAIRLTATEAVLEAAFELLTEDSNASLAEIAKRAGVGRATLHRHFAGRDDLLVMLAKTAMQEMEDAVVASCTDISSCSDALYRILQALIPLGDRYRFLLQQPIGGDPQLAAEIERQRVETHQLVEAARNEGLFDPAVPIHWIVQAYDHVLYAAWESVAAQEATPSQAVDLAWRTLICGLGANAK